MYTKKWNVQQCSFLFSWTIWTDAFRHNWINLKRFLVGLLTLSQQQLQWHLHTFEYMGQVHLEGQNVPAVSIHMIFSMANLCIFDTDSILMGNYVNLFFWANVKIILNYCFDGWRNDTMTKNIISCYPPDIHTMYIASTQKGHQPHLTSASQEKNCTNNTNIIPMVFQPIILVPHLSATPKAPVVSAQGKSSPSSPPTLQKILIKRMLSRMSPNQFDSFFLPSDAIEDRKRHVFFLGCPQPGFAKLDLVILSSTFLSSAQLGMAVLVFSVLGSAILWLDQISLAQLSLLWLFSAWLSSRS